MQSRSGSRSLKPESSIPYYSFLPSPPPQTDNKQQNEIYLKLGVLSQCKGSAYMEFGHTKVICAAFPPQEPTKANTTNTNLATSSPLECEFHILPFATRESPQLRIRKQKSLALAVKKALEPVIFRQNIMNFKIGIYILVLEDSGSLFSTALNCCGAALAEGGIPMYSIFAASTFITDISANFQTTETHDDQICNEITTYSKCATSKQVAECFQKGYISLDTFKAEFNKTLSRNESILTLLQKVMIDRVKTLTINKDL